MKLHKIVDTTDKSPGQGTEPDDEKKFFITDGGTDRETDGELSQEPSPDIHEWALELDYTNEACDKLEFDSHKLKGLCKPILLKEHYKVFISKELPNKPFLTVIGKPKLTIYCKEKSGKPYSFTAILGEMPPENEGDLYFWPVTSERFFRQATSNGWEKWVIDLDTVVHWFKPGNRICLILSPFSLPLDKHLMFCPNMQNYELEMKNYHGMDEAATLSLPIMHMSLGLVDVDWQIFPENYVDYVWEGRGEWEEALGDTQTQ